jgi:hypothetical protein
MSSGFKVAGEEFSGTNGAVEAYVEAMAALAAGRYGADDPMAAYLAGERECPARGWTVSLDPCVVDAASCGRLLELLDAATERLLRDDVFTEYGRAWVATVVAALRGRIVTGIPAEPHASTAGEE